MAVKKSGKAPRGVIPIDALKASVAADKLAAMGDRKTASQIRRAIAKQGKDVKLASLTWPRDKSQQPSYQFTQHAFGFIPKPTTGANGLVDTSDAGNIQAGVGLKNQQIKLTLDRLRVYNYPGGGIHVILFDFYAQHQVSSGDTQDLYFTQNYRVQ